MHDIIMIMLSRSFPRTCLPGLCLLLALNAALANDLDTRLFPADVPDASVRTPAPGWYAGPQCPETEGRFCQCSEGRFCLGGDTSPAPCPAGAFGSLRGEARPQCAGFCAAGWACPAGSSSSRALPCGGPGVFCPAGSGSPTPVPQGYYSVVASASAINNGKIGLVSGLSADGSAVEGEVGDYVQCHRGYGRRGAPCTLMLDVQAEQSDTRAAVRQCQPGTYCREGVAYLCAPGRYGSSAGLTSPLCTGQCAAGFACPAGSRSSIQFECGLADRGEPAVPPAPGEGTEAVYCPSSADSPLQVPAGFYSTRGRSLGWSQAGQSFLSPPFGTPQVYSDDLYGEPLAPIAPATAPMKCDGAYGLDGLHEPAAGRPEVHVEDYVCEEGMTEDNVTAAARQLAAELGAGPSPRGSWDGSGQVPPVDALQALPGAIPSAPYGDAPSICRMRRAQLFLPNVPFRVDRARACVGGSSGHPPLEVP
jgi:hypothetical protein